jgi:hypothetical protein
MDPRWRQGLGLDVGGAAALQASLQALRGAHDAAHLDVVQLMATKPMQVARYFCTGEIEDRAAWGAPARAARSRERAPRRLCSPCAGSPAAELMWVLGLVAMCARLHYYNQNRHARCCQVVLLVIVLYGHPSYPPRSACAAVRAPA